jgi:hypothetical protein
MERVWFFVSLHFTLYNLSRNDMEGILHRKGGEKSSKTIRENCTFRQAKSIYSGFIFPVPNVCLLQISLLMALTSI